MYQLLVLVYVWILSNFFFCFWIKFDFNLVIKGDYSLWISKQKKCLKISLKSFNYWKIIIWFIALKHPEIYLHWSFQQKIWSFYFNFHLWRFFVCEVLNTVKFSIFEVFKNFHSIFVQFSFLKILCIWDLKHGEIFYI